MDQSISPKEKLLKSTEFLHEFLFEAQLFIDKLRDILRESFLSSI